jgi:hypothetical protein
MDHKQKTRNRGSAPCGARDTRQRDRKATGIRSELLGAAEAAIPYGLVSAAASAHRCWQLLGFVTVIRGPVV